MYDPSTGLIGFEDFETPTAGLLFRIPPIQLRIPFAPDSDADGLSDDAEFVIGTDPELPDTDGDGIKDGAEVAQGLMPLDGRPVRTGVTASADTPGIAKDVFALNDVVAVADGPAGVTLFTPFDGTRLIRLAQVDTPGDALRVSVDGGLMAVADGIEGLAVIDVSNPSQARLLRQYNFGARVESVLMVSSLAFVGTATAQLLALDLTTGTVLSRTAMEGPVHDLALGGDGLLVLADSTLSVFRFTSGQLRRLGSSPVTGNGPDGITGTERLFVADGVAYASNAGGYDTFDVTDPTAPSRLGDTVAGGFFVFKQIILNGSGVGLAGTGIAGNLSSHHISLYDTSDPTNTGAFITTLPTPGIAHAVSIYNGLAYVADGEAGLQVLSYLAYDMGANPPTIALSASFPLDPPASEEGKLVRLTAAVTDDVQVRNVEFYLDGQLVTTDGNYPFEYRFVTPLRSSGRDSFTFRARAFDTGGNATWSDLITVPLVADATPPEVLGTFPSPGAIVGKLDSLGVFFDEALSASSVTPNALALRTAGIDGQFGTADDMDRPGGAVSYRDDLNAVALTYPTNLAAGLYEAQLSAGLQDRAGNPLPAPYVWRFWIIGGSDRDQDGIPDDVEAVLGYSPDDPDSDGNGVWDGDEDPDQDGLRNSWELVYGLDPRLSDSNGNGLADGDEDLDLDGLLNRQEQTFATDPANFDSDGDGWDDGSELLDGTDPLNASSGPRQAVSSALAGYLNSVLEAPPSTLLSGAFSPGVAYLNAQPAPLPANLTKALASATLSYSNVVNQADVAAAVPVGREAEP